MMTMGLGRALVVPAAGVAARAMGTAGFATEAAGGKYDYILAGGGTAACVLANRLSKWAPDKRILVLEAGKDNFDHPYVKIPSAIARLFKSDLDWNFTSAKQEEPGLGSNHGGVYLCRGKVLGGSSCTNVLLYNRGTANDYDGWECPGWGAKDVLKYFMRSENNHDASSSAKFHSRDGPFDVNPIQYKSVLTESFLDAGVSFGFEKNDDFNNWDRSQQGVGPFHVAQHRGVRTSAASAYLSEVMGKSNVTILTEALVKKVKLEGKHARGVHFSKAGVDATALLKDGGEVILTAGAVGSPHILMLSGIGPREHLGEHGIACVADLPVGSNLQDHPAALVTYTIDKPLALTDEFKFGGLGIPMLPNPMPILRWFFGGSGPLTSVGCDHGGFFKTDDSKAEPDLQMRFISGFSKDPYGISNYAQYAKEWWKWPSGFTFQNICVRPKSKGHVRLRSGDPEDKPVISTGYLTQPDDLASIRNGIKLSRKLARSSAFSRFNPVELHPGPNVQTDAELDDYIRASAHSGNALVGSCRMGQDPKHCVVDAELRVNGIAGLRVVDSSVIPQIPGGQTCSATLMIAEKGAEMIHGQDPALDQDPALASFA